MQAKSRSIKVLDYAMSGPAGTATCEVFVEALGLKTLFSGDTNTNVCSLDHADVVGAVANAERHGVPPVLDLESEGT